MKRKLRLCLFCVLSVFITAQSYKSISSNFENVNYTQVNPLFKLRQISPTDTCLYYSKLTYIATHYAIFENQLWSSLIPCDWVVKINAEDIRLSKNEVEDVFKLDRTQFYSPLNSKEIFGSYALDEKNENCTLRIEFIRELNMTRLYIIYPEKNILIYLK